MRENTAETIGKPMGTSDVTCVLGSSGHSKRKKLRFSAALCAIFTAMTVITPAKDIYLEKFGADPVLLGVLFLLISFTNPLGEMLSGRLQKYDALSWLFPVEKWGRKAPWLWTHLIILAISTGCLLMPPSRDHILLHAWFTVISIIMFWAVSTTLIAFEASRQELYPYNEERSEVEIFCKVSVIFGIGLGILPVLALLADARFTFQLGSAVWLIANILLWGLQGTPIYKEAKSSSKREASNVWHDLKVSWSSLAFRHMCLVRSFDGAYQGLYAGMLFYYLTYILQLHGLERSVWVVFVGVASMSGEMSMAVYTQQRLRKRPFQFLLQGFVIKARMINCFMGTLLLILPTLLYGQETLAKDSTELTMTRVLFLIFACFNRFFQAPFTFWRVGAQCWVIDEDIHGSAGVRREAFFVSVFSASQNCARAVVSAGSFLGIGFAGLNLVDCETICTGVTDCIGDCTEQNILNQPASLRLYIRSILVLGLGVLEVGCIIHASLFPIRGIRLAKLYNNQTLAVGGIVAGVYDGTQSNHLTPGQMLDKVFGKEKIVTPVGDASSAIEQVTLAQPGPKSVSVVFTLPVKSTEVSDEEVPDEEIAAQQEVPDAEIAAEQVGAIREHLNKFGCAAYIRSPLAVVAQSSSLNVPSSAGSRDVRTI